MAELCEFSPAVFASILLGDEEALNNMWNTKGASGTVPCAILCSVTNKPKPADIAAGVRSLSDRSDLIQDITCSDCSKIGLRNDADVWSFVDRIGAAAASSDAAKLKELQQCYGFNYHRDALLFDNELRRHVKPTTANRNDAQHVLYANGLVGAEIALFLHSTKEEYGVFFKDVRAEMQEWHHPTAWHNPPKACFSEAREKSCHEFLKASASKLLGMYKCFRKFAVDAYSNATKVASQLDSLLKLFRVCDLVTDAMRCKPGRDVEALACSMETAIADYLEAFKKAYGAENMRFKHHMLMHLPNQLRKDGLLVTCWSLERKHIVALQSLQHYKRYEDLGKGPLSKMINAQVQHTHTAYKECFCEAVSTATFYETYVHISMSNTKPIVISEAVSTATFHETYVHISSEAVSTATSHETYVHISMSSTKHLVNSLHCMPRICHRCASCKVLAGMQHCKEKQPSSHSWLLRSTQVPQK